MKQDNVLYAFYDLEVAPATFDICKFIVLAEFERRKIGCDFLHIIIVPGPAYGFREKDFNTYRQLGASDYDIDIMRWRLSNILVPICWLMPSCQKVTICTSRDEGQAVELSLAKHIFPSRYSVRSPTHCHEIGQMVSFASKVAILPSIQATPQGRLFVGDWIKSNVGERKLVTITLRECAYEHARNCSIEDWGAFVQGLDTKIYCPVVLRDVDAAFGPLPPELEGVLIFQEAVWNLELRSALYELSYLNMSTINGTTSLCTYNRKTRFITIYKRNTCGAATYAYSHSQGLAPGSQFTWTTPFQQLVWENDRIDVLQTAFKEMCEKIERFTSARIEDLIATFNTAITKKDLNTTEWVSAFGVEQFPGNPYAWLIRSQALRLTNQLPEAISATKRAILLRENSKTLTDRAILQNSTDGFDKAYVR